MTRVMNEVPGGSVPVPMIPIRLRLRINFGM
jgi:hypothetical protein